MSDFDDRQTSSRYSDKNGGRSAQKKHPPARNTAGGQAIWGERNQVQSPIELQWEKPRCDGVTTGSHGFCCYFITILPLSKAVVCVVLI